MSEGKPISRLEPERQPLGIGTGRIEFELFHRDDEIQLIQGRVHFHDGANTGWHAHTSDQVLYFVAGQGMAQDEDGPVIECGPGDVVHVPPVTRHIHGAMPGHDATHIAITHGEGIWE